MAIMKSPKELSPSQRTYNKLPIDQQQKYNSPAAKQSIQAIKGATTPTANSYKPYEQGSAQGPVSYAQTMDNKNEYIKPAQVVRQANDATKGVTPAPVTPATPAVDPAKTYAQGVTEATSAFKSSGNPNAMKDYTATETQRTTAEADAIRARVRQAIQQGVDQQNKIITDAPAQYVDPMNQASFQGARGAQAIDERMATMGLGRSGSNITAQTANSNQTSGNINNLELQKQKVISDAKQAIANLQASGSLEEVRQVQEAAAKSLDRIQAQQNVIDNRNYTTDSSIFNNTVQSLGKQYEIGANEKQLGMQDRTLGANITGYDPATGQKTASQANTDRGYDLTKAGQEADIAFRNEQFDWNKQSDIWSQKMQNKQFDYTTERNAISDARYESEWKQKLDEVAYSRSENNPMVKSQVISNKIKDLELARMSDPNSPENQMRETAVKSAKQSLDQLMAISPEMKVREFNAGLDKIYQDINASKTDSAYKMGMLSNDTKKTNYDVNRPYSTAGSKPSAAEIKADANKSFGEDYSSIKSLSVEDAYKELTTGAQDYISAYGYDGYKKLYNSVLEAAIGSEESKYDYIKELK